MKHAVRVPEPEAIALRATEVARHAVDELAAYVGPLDDRRVVDDAHMLLIRSSDRDFDSGRRRETWERHSAGDLLMAVGCLASSTDEPEAASVRDLSRVEHDGHVALRNGDLEAAEAAAAQLLEGAGSTPQEDWNHDNLVHGGHILRGLVRLAADKVDEAARELIAAGAIAGSPQLDSFGPDLSLAWKLLGRGRDDAVLEYLRSVARFWSPRGFLLDDA